MSSEGEPVPNKYSLEYPGAEQCCPPIRSTFFEATQTIRVVRGRLFRQKPNGGYGLPVVEKAGDRHLLHVGADLGWLQRGEPVFAVANGVVRRSQAPAIAPDSKKGARGVRSGANSAPMSWGNFVVIEHRFGDQYFTSLYGHLDADRRVKVGDIVRAGQRIGTIGRQKLHINGGYAPHVHFGVREGRIAEVGAKLLQMSFHGKTISAEIKSLGEKRVEVDFPAEVPASLTINVNGVSYRADLEDGKRYLPAKILWTMNRADFPLVGYALETAGWRDPIEFLREHRADSDPAPFLPEQKERSRRPQVNR